MNEVHSVLLLAAVIFVITYAVIIWDKFDRMPVAMAGAAIMIISGVLSQKEAFEAVDFNTVFLLMGMMILVSILRHTGVFGWAGVHVVRLSGGRAWTVMAAFMVFTAVVSAFLDNVTTVLLILPVSLAVASHLEIDPKPLLIAEAIASNIGGTATLIGDPPNIMIGSAVGFDFVTFVVHLAPVVVIVLAVTMFGYWLIYGRQYSRTTNPEKALAALAEMDKEQQITDPVLLKKSLVVIGLTILGFFVHGVFHLEPATIALTGAATLLLLAPNSMHKALEEVEWNTILFFVGLFILVGGVEKVGIFEMAGHWIVETTHGNVIVTAMVILWFAGIASAIVDNIPAVASLIPVVFAIARLIHPGVPDATLVQMNDVLALWWALALGACLGGNATLYGASANVVISGAAARRGSRITFMEFTRIGTPFTVISLLICTAYIYIRYLM